MLMKQKMGGGGGEPRKRGQFQIPETLSSEVPGLVPSIPTYYHVLVDPSLGGGWWGGTGCGTCRDFCPGALQGTQDRAGERPA